VEDNTEYFSFLPEKYIVQGNWPGLEEINKTASAPHSYQDPNYPPHFSLTRCVFALAGGECSLQRLATDQQLHPWHAKPETCWAFPLRGLRDGSPLPPPGFNQPDPDYVDANYPGYATFLPCDKATTKENGDSWKELLFQEITDYRFFHCDHRNGKEIVVAVGDWDLPEE
jgi:hypothetical protein